VMRRLPDASVDAIITDPPYGMAYQSAWRTERERFDPIANDGFPFVWWLSDAARLLRDGGCVLCFCRWDSAEAFRVAIGWTGLRVASQVIWDREVHGMGDLTGSPAPRHDTIWFATKGKYTFPGKRPTSIVRHQRVAAEALVHPNEKPIGLMVDLVRSYTPEGAVVLDPFAGSGATGVACAKNGRGFVGVELDQTYHGLATKRIMEAAPLFGSVA